MTSLQTDIRSEILVALLTAGGPMPEAAVKRHIKNMHPRVAFTDGDLTGYIKDCEDAGLVIAISDDVVGTMWDLTPKGKGKAQQLR